MNKFLSFIKKSWQEGTQIGKSNIITAAVLGGGAHVILYFIYKYHFGLYENIYLRLTTSFLCVSVSCYYYLPKNIKTKYFPFYWHIMLIMALPFVITVNLFKTNFHEAWLYWDIFVMFLLALYVPNWFIYAIDLVIGFGGAFIFYSLTTPGCSLDPQFDILAYSIVFLFSGIAGMGFVYGNRYAWLERQKKQYTDLIEFAGSIAHEMRNPIDAINLSLKTLPEIKVCNSANQIDLDDLKSINEHKDLITKTIKLARGIIDMTLLQLSNKKISKQDFTYLKASEIIKDSVEIYGYKAHEERNKISINIKKDFIFRAIETSFKYTLFNLIKNEEATTFVHDPFVSYWEEENLIVESDLQKLLDLNPDIIIISSGHSQYKKNDTIQSIKKLNPLFIFDTIGLLNEKQIFTLKKFQIGRAHV